MAWNGQDEAESPVEAAEQLAVFNHKFQLFL
jgi:hypothetical protein